MGKFHLRFASTNKSDLTQFDVIFAVNSTIKFGVISDITHRYIVSDCDSVGVFYDNQHFTSTPEEAAASAIKAG